MISGGGGKTDSVGLPEHPDVAVVLRGNLSDLQRAEELLDNHGINASVLRAPDDCSTGGCSTSMYLVVARDDAKQAHGIFESQWKRGLSDEQVAALEAAAEVVIDPNAPETTCPACMTTFATGPSACPDCGLAVG